MKKAIFLTAVILMSLGFVGKAAATMSCDTDRSWDGRGFDWQVLSDGSGMEQEGHSRTEAEAEAACAARIRKLSQEDREFRMKGKCLCSHALPAPGGIGMIKLNRIYNDTVGVMPNGYFYFGSKTQNWNEGGLIPNYHTVYSGQYSDASEAQQACESLRQQYEAMGQCH